MVRYAVVLVALAILAAPALAEDGVVAKHDCSYGWSDLDCITHLECPCRSLGRAAAGAHCCRPLDYTCVVSQPRHKLPLSYINKVPVPSLKSSRAARQCVRPC